MFAPSPALYATPLATGETANVETPYRTVFDSDRAVRSLGEKDFALLMRSAELVVLSQSFVCSRLRDALRIPLRDAEIMTSLLEVLGVIASGPADAERDVLVETQDLPKLLGKILTARESGTAAITAR